MNIHDICTVDLSLAYLKRFLVAEREVVEAERVELERRRRRDLPPRQLDGVLQRRSGVVTQAL